MKWFDYVIAALISYALVWLAVFLEMAWLWERVLAQIRRSHYSPAGLLIVSNPIAWLWLILPAAVSFLTLLPFLRFPRPRWMAFIGLCVGWIYILSLAEPGPTK